MPCKILVVSLLFAALPSLTGVAVAHAGPASLTDLDLTTLMTMDVIVTSAARRPQTSSDAAAAVFVLTRDDIRRTGASTVPELLRTVPGVEVAQITSNSWAVSTRGFSGRYDNKLLVLIDGRSIYTSINSGVKWEEQFVPIEEIERVEVVRGPGGALWGANAVNGVINIMTRSAADARGLEMTAGGGNERPYAAHVSLGGSAGRAGDFRAYVDAFEQDSFNPGDSPWRRQQAGAQLDSAYGEARVTVQGETYWNDLNNIYTFPSAVLSSVLLNGAPIDIEQRGGNVNARWAAPCPMGGEFDVRTYYSWRVHRQIGVDSEHESILDLDSQYAAPRLGRHLAIFGANVRQVADELRPNFAGRYDPQSSRQNQWAFYAQDEIHYLRDELRFTVGAKLEHFATTGAAFEPTLRALWHASPTHTLWTAYSRAARTPSRNERDLRVVAPIPGNPPILVEVLGNADLRNESVRAEELGWRWRPAPQWSLDASLYRQRYSQLIDLLAVSSTLDPGPPPTIIAVNRYGNADEAETRGTDAVLEWIATPWMLTQVTGSWFRVNAPVTGAAISTPVGSDPSRELSLRLRVDPSHTTEVDLRWRRVGPLSIGQVPAYDSADLRIGWRPARNIELSAAIRNLLGHRHVEAIDTAFSVPGNKIGRSVLIRASVRLND